MKRPIFLIIWDYHLEAGSFGSCFTQSAWLDPWCFWITIPNSKLWRIIVMKGTNASHIAHLTISQIWNVRQLMLISHTTTTSTRSSSLIPIRSSTRLRNQMLRRSRQTTTLNGMKRKRSGTDIQKMWCSWHRRSLLRCSMTRMPWLKRKSRRISSIARTTSSRTHCSLTVRLIWIANGKFTHASTPASCHQLRKDTTRLKLSCFKWIKDLFARIRRIKTYLSFAWIHLKTSKIVSSFNQYPKLVMTLQTTSVLTGWLSCSAWSSRT